MVYLSYFKFSNINFFPSTINKNTLHTRCSSVLATRILIRLVYNSYNLSLHYRNVNHALVRRHISVPTNPYSAILCHRSNYWLMWNNRPYHCHKILF
jgi:hypothetical protein